MLNNNNNIIIIDIDMAKLAYASDLGSGPLKGVGSTPIIDNY